jgi:phage-related tail fiber protein
MATFKSVVTTLGQARIAAAIQSGKDINIIEMAVGDGGGKATQPSAAQTKLVKEVYRTKLNSLKLDTKNANWVIAEAIISASVGGFWMREMGLYADDGVLIAVCNMADTYKPTLAEGSGRTQTLRMVITVTDTSAVTLTLDDSLIVATEEYVNDLLAAHEKSRNHPDGTLTAKGFVQLNSATNSTSETLAATPKAVKAANDNANGRLPSTGTAVAAKKLETARKIAGNDFDGTKDISISAADVGAWSSEQSESSQKALADEIATAFKIRPPLTPADSLNTLRGLEMYGHYGVAGAAAATKAKGYPIDGFVGAVLVMLGGNSTQQVAFASTGRQWTRYISGAWNGTDGPWSAWSETYSEKNKPTAADVSALPVISGVLGATNINTLNLAKIGLYVQSAGGNASVANGYPSGAQAAGVLEVIPASWTGGVLQRYTVQNTGMVWTRALNASWNGVDGPWRDWVQASAAGSISMDTAPLSATTDLNTLGVGIYFQNRDANATLALNYPITHSGTLVVTPSAYGVQQEYTTYKGGKYIRGAVNSAGLWGAWFPVYTGANPPPYPVTKVNGKTGDLTLSSADVGALPTTGGDVEYINGARHYASKPGIWEGAGGFAAQFENGSAPFMVPFGYMAPKGFSQYHPIAKAILQTLGYGYAAAISFGGLTSGGSNFPSAVININTDGKTSVSWSFNPANGSFESPGDVIAGKNITAAGSVSAAGGINAVNDIYTDRNIFNKGKIQAGAGVYDTDGVRVYSPNYRPLPAEIGAIAQDTCSVAGFAAGNSQAPYMRNSSNNEVVSLARQDWAARNFISSVRLVGRTVMQDTGGRIDLPVGCVYTGMSGSNYNPATWGAYSVIQIWVNGGWVTVGSV